MCVLLKVQKQLLAGAYKLMHKLHNIVPMNIIICPGLSCNFFKCPAKMSLVSCIDFYSGWHVWEGTICTSANCPGGQFALVRSVRGHGATPCTPTPEERPRARWANETIIAVPQSLVQS